MLIHKVQNANNDAQSGIEGRISHFIPFNDIRDKDILNL